MQTGVSESTVKKHTNVIKAVAVLLSMLSFDEGVSHCVVQNRVVAAVLILESWDGGIT